MLLRLFAFEPLSLCVVCTRIACHISCWNEVFYALTGILFFFCKTKTRSKFQGLSSRVCC